MKKENKMKPLTVLSCFDGMSCGQIALERAGIPVTKYYACEIDKYAIQVTQANYPETIQLGSITEWKNWNIEQPDIIIGGSPCQGFSFAGKQLNFNDPRSALFFTFVDVLKHYKPKYFLLENVVMAKEHNDVISEILGKMYPECVTQPELFRTGRLEPIQINSALVSAQNRPRLYWTNIPGIEQPEDKGILLKDIIEDATTEKEKAYCINANYFKGASEEQYKNKSRRQLVKAGRIIGRNPENPKSRKAGLPTKQRLEIREDEKTNCLSTVQKDNVIVKTIPHGYMKENISSCNKCPPLYAQSPDSKHLICEEKSQTILSTLHKENVKSMIKRKKHELKSGESSQNNTTWRKLTPLECERLQTVPDNYTNHVSNTQRYKMLGNGWTVDVIAHIFSYIKNTTI